MELVGRSTFPLPFRVLLLLEFLFPGLLFLKTVMLTQALDDRGD
jgi:hypothetical protein